MREQTEGQAIKRDVLVLFEYAHHRDEWVNPLADTLEGVTVAQALWQPAPDAKCIWEIVLHMATWTENVVERMQGAMDARPNDGDWPALPTVCDEVAWASARARLGSALQVFRAQVAAMSPAMLLDLGDRSYSLLDEVICRYLHNAYHIGQIVKLRECLPHSLSSE